MKLFRRDTRSEIAIAEEGSPVGPKNRAKVSRRHLMERTSSGSQLFRRRSISPATRRRMDVALGLTEESIISSPAVLHEPKKSSRRRSKPSSSVKSSPVTVAEKNGSTPRSLPRLTEITLPKEAEKSILRRDLMRASQTWSRSGSFSSSTKFKTSKGKSKSERHLRIPDDDEEPTAYDSRIGNTMYGSSVGIQTSKSCATTKLVFKRKSSEVKEKIIIPSGNVTIVVTDIQGSTSMWEQDPPAMKDALDLHDGIMRKCYAQHNGYEITTEGDSFHLAFQHPIDALSFCLQCQIMLHEAQWSQSILKLNDAKEIKDKAIRGVRVRMGVHHGPTVSEVHTMTQRTHFRGETVDLAKAVEASAHGGQVVLTLETWRNVSGMAERYLGSPQVIDLGLHELEGKMGENFTAHLVQLVPKRFAFDYFLFRGMRDVYDNRTPTGRSFPALESKKQLSAAFNDAPYVKKKVTILFAHTIIDTKGLRDDEITHHTEKIGRTVRYILNKDTVNGYECQEDNGVWMLAFHSVGSAIIFGLNLLKKLEHAPANVKVGINSGRFTTMGPHKVTGRADYFGPIVNRCKYKILSPISYENGCDPH